MAAHPSGDAFLRVLHGCHGLADVEDREATEQRCASPSVVELGMCQLRKLPGYVAVRGLQRTDGDAEDTVVLQQCFHRLVWIFCFSSDGTLCCRRVHGHLLALAEIDEIRQHDLVVTVVVRPGTDFDVSH